MNEEQVRVLDQNVPSNLTDPIQIAQHPLLDQFFDHFRAGLHNANNFPVTESAHLDFAIAMLMRYGVGNAGDLGQMERVVTPITENYLTQWGTARHEHKTINSIVASLNRQIYTTMVTSLNVTQFATHSNVQKPVLDKLRDLVGAVQVL